MSPSGRSRATTMPKMPHMPRSSDDRGTIPPRPRPGTGVITCGTPMGRGIVAAETQGATAAKPVDGDPRTAQPLRILQVNSLLNGGGADSQTLELCAGLQELHQDVTLAVAAGCRWERLAKGLPGVRVVTLPLSQGPPIGVTRWLTALIRERSIQVVHAHQGRDYWPAIIAARLAGRGARGAISRHLVKRPKVA